MGLAGAVIGAGALTAVGGIASSAIGAGAARSAADKQAQAAKDAAARLQPFTDVGQTAIPTIKNLLGINASGGLDPTLMQDTLQQTPGYQFTRQQGLEAVQNGFAGQGLARSGAAMKGAEGFASGLASQTYQNILGNYTNLLANSQSAAAGQGGVLIGGANAQAAGIIGSANAISNGLTGTANTVGNTAVNYALLNQLSPGAYGSAAGISPVDVTPINPAFGGGVLDAGTALGPALA